MVFFGNCPQVVFRGNGGGGLYQVVYRRRGILQFAFDVVGNGVAQNGVHGGKGHQERKKEKQRIAEQELVTNAHIWKHRPALFFRLRADYLVWCNRLIQTT